MTNGAQRVGNQPGSPIFDLNGCPTDVPLTPALSPLGARESRGTLLRKIQTDHPLYFAERRTINAEPDCKEFQVGYGHGDIPGKQPIVLDKLKKYDLELSVEKFIVPKTILLLVLTLFLTEYLNPSAIGVRADYTPTPTGSPASGSQAPSGSEAPSATPHFMIKSETYRPGEIFPSQVLFSSVKSLTEQTNQKKIFHPPAFTL